MLSRMSVRMVGSEKGGAVYEDAVDELRESDEPTSDDQYHFLVIQQRTGNPSGLDGLVLQPTGVRKGQFRRCGLLRLNLADSCSED